MHLPTLLRLLLGPLVVLLALEVGLRHSEAFWRLLASFEPMSPTWADGQLALARPGEVDVVVLGSSIALFDIDETVLDRELGTRTVNAAVAGSTTWHVAMRLPRALRLEPRVVIVAIDLSSVGARQGSREDAWTARAALALVPASELLTDGAEHLQGLASDASVLYRYRHVPRAVLVDGALDWVHPRDWTRKTPGDLRGRREKRTRQMRRGSDDNETALCWIGRESAARGARAVIVVGPVNPRLRVGVEEPARERLGRIAERCGLELVPAEVLGTYEAREYIDSAHLGRGGRTRLTRALAGWLRSRLED